MDWDSYFLSIADVVRRKSKDPDTKVGAVIIGPEKQIISTGYNGFPRGVDETDLRRWQPGNKKLFVEHAERNAIYNAARHGIALRDCTMYTVNFGPPVVPCIECARAIIQAGIVRVVGIAAKKADKAWIKNLVFAKDMLLEAGIVVDERRSDA